MRTRNPLAQRARLTETPLEVGGLFPSACKKTLDVQVSYYRASSRFVEAGRRNAAFNSETLENLLYLNLREYSQQGRSAH